MRFWSDTAFVKAEIEGLDAVNEKNLYCVCDQAGEGGITVKKVQYDKAAHCLHLYPLNPSEDFHAQTIYIKKSDRHPVIGRVIGIWREMI